ncbi:MAG: glycoside hydrolase family 11 protein [Cellvibrionaceae bacterium]|nr:glycoside hydrolase family 11 protein [Cellvibrionaceae bacterium]
MKHVCSFIITLAMMHQASASFESGNHNGFYWQLWQSNGLSGNVNYTNGPDGNYSVSWDANGNFTCGKGWSTGTTNRVIGYNAGSYSQSGGGGAFGVYGWTTSPLIEYYVQERWPASRPTSGINMGRVTSDGGTYDLRREQRVNAPSIDGTQTFWQLKSTRTSPNPLGSNHEVTFANHARGWANGGMSLGSNHSYQIFLTEAWGDSSGYANVSVWDGGSSNGGSSSSSSSSSNSSSSSSGGSEYPVGVELPLRLRARSTDGQGVVNFKVGSNTVATWTLSSTMSDYSISLWSSRGEMVIEYANDAQGRDVEIDYLSVGGSLRQAENQANNTAVYQNGSCGGSNSQWMHCNGIISFGNTP